MATPKLCAVDIQINDKIVAFLHPDEIEPQGQNSSWKISLKDIDQVMENSKGLVHVEYILTQVVQAWFCYVLSVKRLEGFRG